MGSTGAFEAVLVIAIALEVVVSGMENMLVVILVVALVVVFAI